MTILWPKFLHYVGVLTVILYIVVKHVERDFDTEAEDCYIAMKALSEVTYGLLYVLNTKILKCKK